MKIIIAFALLGLAVLFWFLSFRKIILNEWLDRLDKIASVLAFLTAIIVFIFPINTETTPLPSSSSESVELGPAISQIEHKKIENSTVVSTSIITKTENQTTSIQEEGEGDVIFAPGAENINTGDTIISTSQITNILPLPTSTPIPVQPAVDDEVLILITDFVKSGAGLVEAHIYSVLDERILNDKLTSVRISRLEGITPRSASEAIKIGKIYSATLVIWGIADELGIRPNYEVVNNQRSVKEEADLGVMLASDLPSFQAYILKETPAEFEYLMLFSLGQMAQFSLDYQKAVRLYDEALKLSSQLQRKKEVGIALAHIYRGLSYLQLYDYDAALKDANKAIEIDSELAKAYNFRGYVYSFQNLPDAAIAEFGHAIELDSNYLKPYINIGYEYAANYDFATALSYYNLAMERDVNSPLVYRNLGFAYFKLGQIDKAVESYERAIQLSPTDSSNYDAYSKFYFDRGNYQIALDNINKAIELDLFPEYLVARADIYRALRNYDAAIADYNKAIEIAPKFVWAYTNLAWLYQDINKIPQSFEVLEKAINIDENDVNVLIRFGELYLALAEYDKAQNYFERVVELRPSIPNGYFGLGNVFFDRGNFEAALAKYEQARQLDPFSIYPYHAIIVTYGNWGKSEALDVCRKALEINRDSIAILLACGEVNRRIKNFDNSLKSFNDVLKLDKENPEALRGLGNIHFEKREYSEAITYYELAIAQNDDASQTNLARMYRDGIGVSQNFTEAIRLYKLAAAQRHSTAQLELGRMYERGMGVSVDYDEAIRLYSEAAKRGEKTAIAILYEKGIGVPKDPIKARYLYYSQATFANNEAMLRLSDIYEQGIGVPKDLAEAERWKRNAATHKGVIAFYSPCYKDGHELAEPCPIYIFDYYSDSNPPLIEEQERLLREKGATLPADVVNSLYTLWKIAKEHDVSFQELCVYALGAAKDGLFTPEQLKEQAAKAEEE